jgi:hypothetical protein
MLRLLRAFELVILLGFPLLAFGSVDAEEALVGETEAEFNRLWETTLKLASVDSSSKDVVWATQIQNKVAEPFLTYWALDDLLSLLLETHNEGLGEPWRSQVIDALGVTLTRYVFEVLLDYDVNQQTIKDLEVHLKQEAPSIDAKVEGPLGISVALRYLLIKRDDQVFIRDMEVANIRYSNWKKSFYLKYAKKADWQGLILALNKKNNRFFAQFCKGSNNQSVMPLYIKTACEI